MRRNPKKYVNPKTAFFILCTIFCILVAFSMPVYAQLLSKEEQVTTIFFTTQFFVWGFFGLLAGIGIAFIGLASFSEYTLVKSIRFLLILLIILALLLYIAVKVYTY
jgi:hypothetical protein